jgi:CheY-like chemotaxis protein
MADRLLGGPVDASQRRDVETLARSAQCLLAALNEMLDFSHFETGEAELAVEQFDLHALVKNAASVLQDRASAKGLMSEVDKAANCPRFILGDEARVRQILLGLINTALESTSEGSIRLYVSVNDDQYPFTVRFDVTNTGEGLSEVEQEVLFQASADTSRAGDTLGLQIAQRLAEAMGGGVGCNGVVGQGTLYWSTFKAVVADDVMSDDDPARADSANDDVEAPSQAVGQPSPEPAPAEGVLSGHMLVVENNTVNRTLISAYLDEFGLTYEMVENGGAALRCLSARSYDLVLMDTALPDYDGHQMVEHIRALHLPSSEVPIVALAAPGAKDDFQALVAAGVNGRVTKPIQGRALYAALVPFLPANKDRMTTAKAS